MIRIGNCSGFYGDRLAAMREMLTDGDLDYLTGDYLAELTMLILGRDRMKDASLGYAKTFVRQMTDCMGLAKERGVRIVTNAGGLNPAGLAEKLREIASEQGLDIVVAHVEGDDLRPRADELGLVGHGGQPPITANAYLGAFGIAAALDAGADVVVTGRVTDASVVVGPAIHAYGWGREDYDALAGAVVAGHVVECGAQATGGNFSGFATLDPKTMLHPGFPIAEIAADGSSVITKHEGTGGVVSVDTVTAQLVYEIGGPAYAGPDVVTHLDSVVLTQDGEDRVAVSGVRGSAPPATTKVALNSFGGFRNSVEFVLTGLDIEEKAALVRLQVEDALAQSPAGIPDEVVWDLDRTDVEDPETQGRATALLRCHVKAMSPDPVGRAFSSAAVELALASYPGFTVTRPPAAGTPYGVYTPAYVPQEVVPHTVVLADGTRLDIPAPTSTLASHPAHTRESPRAHSREDSAPAVTRDPARGDSRAVPLGRVVHTRSGDKGGDANVGVWVRSDVADPDAAYAWLVELLDAETFRTLIPEAADLDLEIHPLPNLRAVNVVAHGFLGDGVAASTRFDPQAKALGEWLRARVVDVPEELLP
ncbi:acyclic terpene utilization AtuA family protein [Mumia quercus]|uniref:acyclic terpene utilization AtuA family protein n=1 Tax=Mumia quercus TaxID=2976125 RepID=UPI0021CF5B82|nr:acyclic terpene utilization AtuA family protein [Mumia quercus]